MSSRTIELFRQFTEKQEEPPAEHERQQPQEPSEHTAKTKLVLEMSRIEHEVRQLFRDASAADRDNIIHFLEVLVRNLRRERQADE
jgi:hypothetical protein